MQRFWVQSFPDPGRRRIKWRPADRVGYETRSLWSLVSFVPAYFIVVIDAYPSTAEVEQGTTLVLVCRVVGVPFTTVLSYQWTCPGGSCDAGAVDPEWAAKVQQGNILVVNVRNGNDAGDYTCTVVEEDSTTHQVAVDVFTLSVASEYNYYVSILMLLLFVVFIE